MDINIQVCVVYVDGTVRIYGQQPRDGGSRQYIKTLRSASKYPSYGKALQFAREFEEKQIEDFVQQRKKRLK